MKREKFLAALREIPRSEVFKQFADAGDLVHGFEDIGLRLFDRSFDRKAWLEELAPDELNRAALMMMASIEKLFAANFLAFNARVTERVKTKSDAASKSAKLKADRNPEKLAVKNLWPEAARQGWTAERFYIELLRRDNNVKADTVRKWLTKLRKTGTC